MIRKERLALVGIALLALVSAVPARTFADDKQELSQAAADCASSGGWFDDVAGVCDVGGVK
jgi:hypothetical protein